MAEIGEVSDGHPCGGGVVGRDERGADPLVVAVDQDERHAAFGERGVAGRVGRHVGVQPGEEDDPADAPFDELLDEFVLGGTAGQLGAEHRGVAVPGQHLLDGLRERREDRVGELGRHQSDQPGAAPPQPYGAFVAEDVQRGEHPLTRGVRDARFPVEHPADGRLADRCLAA